MKVRTDVKAGGPTTTPSRKHQGGFGPEMSSRGLGVRTNLKAGRLGLRLSGNHNETLVRDAAGISVKTGVRAGGPETTPSRK